MDAATADALLVAAQDARAAMRSGDDAAVDRLEGMYPDLQAALEWNVEQGRTDQADRLATALVPFWIATKRIDEGQAWFERAIPEPGTDPRRARAEYDYGYLAFFAGHYELAETQFADCAPARGGRRGCRCRGARPRRIGRVALNTDPGRPSASSARRSP